MAKVCLNQPITVWESPNHLYLLEILLYSNRKIYKKYLLLHINPSKTCKLTLPSKEVLV